ncbi:MAG: hypothetical protein Q8N53_01935 [Longimicrobiales bacterium]|nr:hypothetical protein [Longimicrobiales bacterium]
MSKNSRSVWSCVAFVVFAAPLAGQQEGRPTRFVVGLGMGAAVPSGDVGDVVGTGLSIGIVAGYHLHRLLRLDAAGDDVLSGSSTTHTILTTGGERSVSLENESFLRAGPSLVLPAPNRLLLTVGVGVVWGRYVEGASGYNEIITGFEPESRSGTGRYGTVSLERMVTSVGGSGRGLGVGISVSHFSMGTDGASLHGLFTGSSRDRWTTVGVVAVGHF